MTHKKSKESNFTCLNSAWDGNSPNFWHSRRRSRWWFSFESGQYKECRVNPSCLMSKREVVKLIACLCHNWLCVMENSPWLSQLHRKKAMSKREVVKLIACLCHNWLCVMENSPWLSQLHRKKAKQLISTAWTSLIQVILKLKKWNIGCLQLAAKSESKPLYCIQPDKNQPRWLRWRNLEGRRRPTRRGSRRGRGRARVRERERKKKSRKKKRNQSW